MKQVLKITTLLTVCFALSCSLLFAQNASRGIYLSVKDFNDHKISFSQVPGKKYKMHLNEILYKPVIKITIGDSTFTFKKDNLFGYRDNDNTMHRFYGKADYTILNPGENILLYSSELSGGYHNSQTIVQYYFSANTNTPVLPLTKWNIKTTFSADSNFHELLDMYFYDNSDLLSYDNFYKTYKLNRVLQCGQQMTLKQITNQ